MKKERKKKKTLKVMGDTGVHSGKQVAGYFEDINVHLCCVLTSSVDLAVTSEIPATCTLPFASSRNSRKPKLGFSKSRIISL